MREAKNNDIRDRLEFAIAAAREAGDLTLRYYQMEQLAIEIKPDASPVTEADRNAEKLIRGRLATSFPDDGIVGEEFGSSEGETDFVWYLDPVDGTRSFVRGVPLYGTMIGLVQGDEAVAGVIYFPALSEIYFGSTGDGAWWGTGVPLYADLPGRPTNLRRARVSQTSVLKQAMLSTTSVEGWQRTGRIEGYLRLMSGAGSDSGWSDCYGHMLVASGRAEIMVDAQMNDYDCAPVQPIVEAAGGCFTDLGGNRTFRGKSAISTNGLLHEEALRLIRGG